MDDECNCGPNCQNQRFQRKQFAKVSVIKTEKKGFGLRADTDLEPNAFIFEYIGEVINEPTFRRRTIQYDQEGVKHFYFMSLTKSEFVDATKKGNLGRFCNHSCNPNCYVDKWVVGDKLRMGIFAERHIKAGEELVFNYNVDRYGADPQPCYCGEPNCTGFLGGKTQTERATKLSHTTVEALGIDDGDGWDTAVAKKPRKKKTGEADEEWVSSTQPKPLNTRGVASLMATLMQCKEKWIVVKLLDRVIKANDDRVYSEVLRFHGYQTMRSAINQWKEDNNVILQVLTILYKLPRVSKNKIVDAKIEPTIHELTTSEHEDIASESKRLLDEWSKLQVAYRIPRKKNDPAAQAAYVEAVKKADPELWAKLVAEYTPRRPKVEEKPAVATKPAISAPTGPRGTIPQRGPIRAPPPRRIGPLPSGWHEAVDGNGRTYYYSKTGLTAWQRPTIPVREPVEKPASGLTMAQQNQRDLQAIIDDVMKQASNKPAKAPATPATQEEAKPEKSEKDEKWRSWPIEQQMKQYEKTVSFGPLFPTMPQLTSYEIAPVIQYFVDKYKKSFPKDVLKQHAKQLAKKVVASDFKRDRVDNPSKLSPMQKDTIKSFAREFFQSAFKKHKERERQKRKDKEQANQLKLNGARSESKDADSNTPSETPARTPLYADNEGKIDVSDDEGHDIDMPNATPADSDESRKRKADDELDDGNNKRVRESQGESNGDFMIPPPPPSPPPVGFGTPSIYNDMRQIDGGMDAFALQTPRDVQTPREESKEDAEMRAAQEELEKENEANAAMETKAAVDDVNTQAFLQNDIALSGTGDITDGASTSKNDERKDGFSASQPTAAI